LDVWTGHIHQDWVGTVDEVDRHFRMLWRHCLDRPGQLSLHGLLALIGHQPQADLCTGHGWYDRLGSLARETSAYAMDIQGGQ
jgi:hypothetical protein